MPLQYSAPETFGLDGRISRPRGTDVSDRVAARYPGLYTTLQERGTESFHPQAIHCGLTDRATLYAIGYDKAVYRE